MKRLIIILIEVLTYVYGFGQSAYMHEAQEDVLHSEPIDAIGVLYVITFGGIIWLISAFIKYYSIQRRGNKLNQIAKDSSKSKYPRTGNSIADSVWKELIDRKEKERKINLNTFR